jgi:hypothetical protein
MEYLFSTHIEDRPYRIVFDKEKYIFLPDADDGGGTSFSFRREHDEWHAVENISDEIKSAAIDALDRYLMKQH